MGMQIEDLEAFARLPIDEDPPILEDDELDEVEQLRQDIFDAISILSQSRNMLAYLADPELCKTLTKKERTVLAELVERIETFVGDVGDGYESENDE